MNNQKDNSQGNPIDAVLNQDQEPEISRPETVEGVGFGDKLDNLANEPTTTSKEHSLDDLKEMQTPSCMEKDVLGEAVDAIKEDAEG